MIHSNALLVQTMKRRGLKWDSYKTKPKSETFHRPPQSIRVYILLDEQESPIGDVYFDGGEWRAQKVTGLETGFSNYTDALNYLTEDHEN